jgi:hypothetical protein
MIGSCKRGRLFECASVALSNNRRDLNSTLSACPLYMCKTWTRPTIHHGVDKLVAVSANRPVDALLANAGHGLGKAFLDQDFEKTRHGLIHSHHRERFCAAERATAWRQPV